MRTTFAKIDLDNLYHNYQKIRTIVGSRKIIGVVKANAYGHSLIEVGRSLEEFGIEYLAVAFVTEGIALRKAGVEIPILVLVPENDNSIEPCIDYNLDYSFETIEVARKISSYASRQGKRARLHLYVDTGLGRDGISPNFAVELMKESKKLPNIDIVGLMSHFATSESDVSYAKLQLDKFNNIVDELQEYGFSFEITHIANSGALFSLPESWFNAVRPGLVIYGYVPNGIPSLQNDFRPVMELHSRVVSKRKITCGETVGYGRRFVAQKDTNVVTVPIGYADGLFRNLSSTLFCLINGKRYKVVGGICMDEIMVEIGWDDVRIGDEVVFIGRQGNESITGFEIANQMGTIVYEVLTAISDRVPRIFSRNGKEK